MKKIIIIFSTLLISIGLEAASKKIHDYSLIAAMGKNIELNEYKGKTILFVNIATKCGYTGQLDDLENLYKKYTKQGLIIIGIPSNDFGGQTPESNGNVAKFCRLNYGVSFPLTSKLTVKEEKKNSFIKDMLKASGGKEIAWNFEKFLFDKNGIFIERYLSSVKPLESSLEKRIQELLK